MLQKLLGTANGKAIDPYNYDPVSEFCPESTAKSLAHICRYNGHYGFMSVAEHCVLVSQLMSLRWIETVTTEWEERWKLAGLLHDAIESIIGDITSPVKAQLYDLQDLEKLYLTELFKSHKLYVSEVTLENLKIADNYAMSIELAALGQRHNQLWAKHFDLYPPERYSTLKAYGSSSFSVVASMWFEEYRRLKDRVFDV